jgi:hypothetical protein
MFEDGNFAFIAPKETGNIFLMREDYHHGNSYRKSPVEWFFFIENKKNEYGKGDAGKD